VSERWFVVCKTCGKNINLNESFVPPALKEIHPVNPEQKEVVSCEYCESMWEYAGEDFRTYYGMRGLLRVCLLRLVGFYRLVLVFVAFVLIAVFRNGWLRDGRNLRRAFVSTE
jgi:hypothetical protein